MLLTVRYSYELSSNYGFSQYSCHQTMDLRYSCHQTRASYGTVIILGFLRYSYHQTMASYGTVDIKLRLLTVHLSSYQVSYGTVIIKLWLLTVQLSNWGYLQYSYHKSQSYSTVIIKLGLLLLYRYHHIRLLKVQLSLKQGFLMYSYNLTRAS